eukprot:scaffold23735_cov122-Isochrysis_galbana.AAC.3
MIKTLSSIGDLGLPSLLSFAVPDAGHGTRIVHKLALLGRCLGAAELLISSTASAAEKVEDCLQDVWLGQAHDGRHEPLQVSPCPASPEAPARPHRKH